MGGKRRSRHALNWYRKYGDLTSDPDATIECGECGSVLEGDSRVVSIVCLDCWMKKEDPLHKLLDEAKYREFDKDPPLLDSPRIHRH